MDHFSTSLISDSMTILFFFFCLFVRRIRSSAKAKPNAAPLSGGLKGSGGEDLMASIVGGMKSSDWKERERGVTELVDLVCTRTDDVIDCIPKLFFPFIERINDSNSKVGSFLLFLFCLGFSSFFFLFPLHVERRL